LLTCSNLINANHVIFLAPFDASSHYAYGASRTQCIGRALRYGQKKKVYVYDFLALKTFDVDVFEYREGKRLMKKTCGDSVEWSMVNQKGLTPEEELKLAESDPKDPITKGMDDQESLTSEGMVDQENLTEGVIDQENLTDEEMDDQESLTAEEKLEMGIFGCGYNYRFSDAVRDRDDLGDA